MLKIEKPVGILGGTFDPVHLGHIHLAREVMMRACLSKIIFIPCYQSSHKNGAMVGVEDRLAMLDLAICNEKDFVSSDIEIRRKNISYTIDTLIALRSDYPNTPFCLIMGDDVFLKFKTWHKWQNILDMAHLIVATRGNLPFMHKWQKMQDVCLQRNVFTKEKLFQELSGAIFHVDINPLPISATYIRSLIHSGKSAENLVSEKVWNYIEEHKLYR